MGQVRSDLRTHEIDDQNTSKGVRLPQRGPEKNGATHYFRLALAISAQTQTRVEHSAD